MNKLTIVPTTKTRTRIPTFWGWLHLQWITFWRLSPSQRRLATSIFAFVTLSMCCFGYVAFASVGEIASDVQFRLKKEQLKRLARPYNIVKPTPDPVPAITSEFTPDGGNEAAPVEPVLPQGAPNAQAYIQRFAKIAIADMRKYGVPASISLAQGIIESRSGTSKMAVNNNNHFGMKCFSKNCRKGHCTNFTDDTHKDFFLKFPTAKQSWDAHAKLLSSGRYAKLKKYGRDYRRWAHGLKKCGYATDRTYAQKLIGVIEKFGLHRYDH